MREEYANGQILKHLVENVMYTITSDNINVVFSTWNEKKFANMKMETFTHAVKVDDSMAINVKVPCAVSFEDVNKGQ